MAAACHVDPADRFRHLHLVGDSPPFRNLLRAMEQVMRSDIPVLIQGETGTGKELVARALHYLGPRRGAGFIPMNCGALPTDLVESELFGHERGAFTGAHQRQPGLVELAHHGTLFLDEVDALDLRAQVSLLRFLQNQEYRLVGGREFRHADVRIIAAGNRSLSGQIQAHQFREDLYYRLNLLTLCVPPLRERGDDILLLANYFLTHFDAQYERPSRGITPEGIEWLKGHTWPGNVRELENAMHRASLLCHEGPIHIEALCFSNPTAPPAGAAMLSTSNGNLMSFTQAKKQAIDRFEKGYLRDMLQQAGGNVTLAARMAGKERRAFGKLLKKHGICGDRVKIAPVG
ncbi:sigma-54 interaction domain-containing protein [Ectothiorhodospira lacustris]|uniref:sigma-54 interaction domain-containing protein n=1 Tax=Ectothiorhodospira lacustris TaxID=2899127 RepID=UPI001EE887EC|nr:sigma-54 dependent transcriptional regulator [Ectothiorhodospira lacustris]MCG5508750.1 sigma-54 dependent transcriptional regulator [Ectothiorhodospira lacustris]MCG5520541.1 sigma-54 dependent transcriptional regulator [Ectothiorhodospira lacustris]